LIVFHTTCCLPLWYDTYKKNQASQVELCPTEDENQSDISYTNGYVTSNDTGHIENNILQKIPTLPQRARKVAKLEKTQLDEKQYIAYEIIACTFLLGLVNDRHDKNTNWAHIYSKQ
jgi:hypothetical protein